MIGIFDSGFGGLTVLKPIIELLPEYDYIYLGDNARAPYGEHSPENIKKYCAEAVEYLFDKGAKVIILACNTASSTALEFLNRRYKQSLSTNIIMDVIEPMVEAVIDSNAKSIGLVGTRATIDSKAYDKKLLKKDKNIKIHKKACPLLVPLIEENWHQKTEAVMILKKYLKPIKNANVDTLILGCTHYPMMLKEFQRIMGKKVRILDSGGIMAKSLQLYLSLNPQIEKKLSKKAKRKFLTTDSPLKMRFFIEKQFGIKADKVKKIELKTK